MVLISLAHRREIAESRNRLTSIGVIELIALRFSDGNQRSNRLHLFPKSVMYDGLFPFSFSRRASSIALVTEIVPAGGFACRMANRTASVNVIRATSHSFKAPTASPSCEGES